MEPRDQLPKVAPKGSHMDGTVLENSLRDSGEHSVFPTPPPSPGIGSQNTQGILGIDLHAGVPSHYKDLNILWIY